MFSNQIRPLVTHLRWALSRYNLSLLTHNRAHNIPYHVLIRKKNLDFLYVSCVTSPLSSQHFLSRLDCKYNGHFIVSFDTNES